MKRLALAGALVAALAVTGPAVAADGQSALGSIGTAQVGSVAAAPATAVVAPVNVNAPIAVASRVTGGGSSQTGSGAGSTAFAPSAGTSSAPQTSAPATAGTSSSGVPAPQSASRSLGTVQVGNVHVTPATSVAAPVGANAPVSVLSENEGGSRAQPSSGPPASSSAASAPSGGAQDARGSTLTVQVGGAHVAPAASVGAPVNVNAPVCVLSRCSTGAPNEQSGAGTTTSFGSRPSTAGAPDAAVLSGRGGTPPAGRSDRVPAGTTPAASGGAPANGTPQGSSSGPVTVSAGTVPGGSSDQPSAGPCTGSGGTELDGEQPAGEATSCGDEGILDGLLLRLRLSLAADGELRELLAARLRGGLRLAESTAGASVLHARAGLRLGVRAGHAAATAASVQAALVAKDAAKAAAGPAVTSHHLVGLATVAQVTIRAAALHVASLRVGTTGTVAAAAKPALTGRALAGLALVAKVAGAETRGSALAGARVSVPAPGVCL